VSSRNTAASVRARLLAKARTDMQDFSLVLNLLEAFRQCRLRPECEGFATIGAIARVDRHERIESKLMTPWTC
jgi:hypothetical protein